MRSVHSSEAGRARLSTLLIAFILLGCAASVLVVVRGRAAAGKFSRPVVSSRILATRSVRTLGAPAPLAVAPVTIFSPPPPSFVVTKTQDSNNATCAVGDCSLREAIVAANASSDTNTITFSIPAADAGCDVTSHVCTIAPGSTTPGPLPTITQPVIIDGYSQTGASANTLVTGDDAKILIEVDGTNAGAGANGLSLAVGATNSTVRGLTINRFTRDGISLNNSSNNIISGNFIGTDPTGLIDRGNGLNGIEGEFFTAADSNLIGGTTPAARNIISGNGDAGITFTFASGNIIRGNFIGLGADGTTAVGNTGVGIVAGAFTGGFIIGGDDAADGTTDGVVNARNYISGNNGGVFAGGDFSGATIQGNYIGTDVTGTLARANAYGIGTNLGHITSVGGTTAGAGNLISGNTGDGISLGNTSSVVITGNSIGTKADGSTALANGANGILLYAGSSSTRIGGTAPGAANTIAFNTLNGVRADSGVGNIVRGNSIHDNGGLGIDLHDNSDLADGVTQNDSGDGDSGPNNLQNFPLITSAIASAGTVTVNGTLDSTDTHTFRVDLYGNSGCDSPSGYGEGKTYLGSVSPDVAIAGSPANFTFAFSSITFPGVAVVTATATDITLYDDDNNGGTPQIPHNDTSEFSACGTVLGAAPGTLQFSAANYDDTELNSSTHTVTITVTRTGGSDGPASAHYATSNGSATLADNDYDAASGDFSWTDGDATSRTFNITVHGDTNVEPNETVNLTLSAATGAASGSPNPATLTITNDDAAPPIDFVVNTTADTNDGSCDPLGTGPGNHDCTLREAIAAANADPDTNTITFNIPIADDPGCNGGSGPCTIVLTSALDTIVHNVNIHGPGANQLTINGAGTYNVFTIGSGVTAKIDCLTLTNGADGDQGGAGIFNNGTLTLSRSVVSGNHANSSGGGIENYGSTLTIRDTTFTGNHGTNGGAIYNKGTGSCATLTVINSTFSGNDVDNSGGGIYNDGTGGDAKVTIVNSTFSGNSAGGEGGGIRNNGGSVKLKNTIIARDCVGCEFINHPDVFGDFQSQGHNLIGVCNGSTGFTNGSNGDQIGTFLAPIDPKLGDLGDNGGPTPTRALLLGSPALEAGDNCVLNGCGGSCPQVDKDQRGIGRPQGNFVDIGAFELQAYVVNTTNDSDDGQCSSLLDEGDCSLREAIKAANADAPYPRMIVFGIPTSGYFADNGCDNHGVCTIKPSSRLPVLCNTIFIDGYSQTGATPNTKDLDKGDNAYLKIVLDGCYVSYHARGLELQTGASGSTISGLVIRNFAQADIYLEDDGGDTISGNFLGTDVTGTIGDGSGGTGVTIKCGEYDTIGGDTPADRNLISGHTDGTGIKIEVSDNSVEGNYIGTDRTGCIALANKIGVSIKDGSGNTIGCEVLNGDNVISGNSESGVKIEGGCENSVQGNYIGTDRTACVALPNGTGVTVCDSLRNKIGYAGGGEDFGNVISGNSGDGVLIRDTTVSGNQMCDLVQGNFIGTNLKGTAALPNGGAGVELDGASGNTIGGSNSGEGNVISGNTGDGVEITRGASNNKVLGNFIGVGADGSCLIGNQGSGVEVYHVSSDQGSSNNTIGAAVVFVDTGDSAGTRLAGGNQAATTKTQTGGNRLAEAPPPSGPSVNNQSGANTIAHNRGDGVKVSNPGDVNNLITGNSIYSNYKLGINLVGGDEDSCGVTANDVGDTDEGPNHLQNFPAILSAVAADQQTITGVLHSSSNDFNIDIYLNPGPSCDKSGYGEGKIYLGRTFASTNINGDGLFTFTAPPNRFAAGDIITATAVDGSNNTSEFSRCFQATDTAPAQISNLSITKTAPATVTQGNTFTYTITVANSDTAVVTAADVAVSDTLPAGVSFVSSPQCSNNSGTVTCAGDLLPGTSETFTIVVSADTGTTVSNTASVSASNDPNATVIAPKTATADTQINAATCTPAPSGMVAWYPADGDANDVMGGHNGALLNGATFVPGKVDRAFRFDGADAVVQVADQAAPNSLSDFGANDFTIDTWVNFHGFNGNDVLVAHDEGGGSNNNKWIFWLDGSQLELHLNGPVVGAHYIGVPWAPATGHWYHVAITRSGSTYKFYVDGTQQGTAQTDATGIPDASAPLTIGKAEAISSLDGLLDELEVFNTALSSDDIVHIYNAGSAGKCRTCTSPPAGMVGWWSAENNSNDIAGSNNGTFAAATYAPGKVGQAFSFDGSGASVSVADSGSLHLTSQLTLDAWVNSADLSDDPMIMSKFTAGNNSYELHLQPDGSVRANISGDGTSVDALVSGPGVVTTGAWYHVATTFNAGVWKAYVNGVEVASKTSTVTSIFPGTATLFIGRDTGTTHFFNGLIDEVEVFDSVLSQPDIQAIVNADNLGKCHTSTLQFSSGAYDGNEGGGTTTITVTRTGAHDTPATVKYKTVVGGTATAGADCTGNADYQTTTGTLNFGVNDASETFSVPICSDNVFEGDETVKLQLSYVTGTGVTAGSPTDATLTIHDNDPAPNITIGNVSQNEGSGGGTTNFVFTVSLSTPTQTGVDIGYSTADGTAHQPGDYASTSGTLNIPANGTSGTITVHVSADNTVEPDETFFVNLTSTTVGSITGNQGTGTIENDDCPTSFTVNDSGDAGDANPGDGLCATGGAACTLRAAIEEANASANSCGAIDIGFNIGSATITLTGGQLTANHDVNLNGPTANSVTISGNSLTRVLTVNSGKTVSISSLTISGGNGSGGDGGGIQNNGTLTLRGVTLSGNTAVNGGAIRSDGALILSNTTISGNTATGDGGGLYNAIGQATLTNVTVANNRSDNDNSGSGAGGGIFRISGNVLLHNTIVADNYKGSSPGINADNIGGSVDSLSSYSLVGTGSGGLGNGTNNNQVGVATAFLGALMNNGGPTFTHGLLYNSPAINAGDAAVLNSPLFLNLDQRGKTRPADGDNNGTSLVDIGAYERQTTETRKVLDGQPANVDINDVRATFPCVPLGLCLALGAKGDGTAKPDVEASNTVDVTLTAVPGDAPSGSGPAFEVHPSSNFFVPPATVCFYLPAITNPTVFATLKILHREGGVLVDHGSQTDFANKTVCTQVTSFSQFVVNQPVSPTAANGNVSGRIVDNSGNPVEGAAVRMNGTQNRLAVTDAAGNYHFDNVETNGFYTVVPSRANFSFSPSQRSFSALGLHTEAAFNATSAGNALNPLDTTEYFVRQQYLDFLGREPDESGFNFWVNNIESCGADQNCRTAKRTDTSAAFFLSIEFQQTGYLVYRAYQAAYGEMPGAPVPLQFSEFKPDTAEIGHGVIVNQIGWETALENNKQAYTAEFVQRPRFTAAYPITMTPDQFVDKLFANAGVTPSTSERGAAINEFGSADTSADAAARGRALRRIAENSTLARQEFNQAFVLMQYFGYLRRDVNTGPDIDFSGYNFWLDKLNTFNGNFENAEMVKAFLLSGEYRGRFPR